MSRPLAYSSPFCKRIASALPPIELVKLRCEADFYGASRIIASSLGISEPPKSETAWAHGWVPDPVTHPRQILGNNAAYRPMLVTNQKRADFLRSHGIQATAAGGPFIYATVKTVQRISGSLLVMPPHVTKHSTFHINQDDYVNYIASIKNQFDEVLVCISKQCLDRGVWADAFHRAGVGVIAGAAIDDRNALLRMGTLLRQFEYVTSNQVGSHLVYAAFCGCKVSLDGPVHKVHAGDYANEPFYQRYPKLLETLMHRLDRETNRQHYPHLGCSPVDAQTCEDWGATELGSSARQTPKQLAKLLRWDWWHRSTRKVRELAKIPFHRTIAQ